MDKELQEKIVLYQILQKHLEELRENIINLQRRLIELDSTIESLKDVSKLKENNEILVPIGSGCYLHGKIMDFKKVVTNLGAGVMTHKKIEDAIKLVEDNKKEVERLIGNLQNEMEDVASKIDIIASEIDKISRSKQE